MAISKLGLTALALALTGACHTGPAASPNAASTSQPDPRADREAAAPRAEPAATEETATEDTATEETATEETGEPEPTERVFFAALPVNASPRVSEMALQTADNKAFARQLRVRMHVMRGYKDLGELTKRSGLPLVNGVFQLSDVSHLVSRDRLTKAYKQPSFVVDFDEPALSAPSQALVAKHPQPAPEDVARFVSEYIEQKSYQRAFDIASRVATSKAGDCTEHAVLTAALLRKSKIPARVILGIVVLAVSIDQKPPRLMAVGHSWVEFHDGKSWQIADAALRPEDEQARARTGAPDVANSARVRLAYLPITVMKDESVAFARALMDQVGVESVTRVELDAAPAEQR